MSEPIGRLAIVGLGLLGGSVALASRSRGAARQVIGASRSRESLETALARGAVDQAFPSASEAVSDADFVVLATPPYAMPTVLRAAAPGLANGAVVTDVGSVKGTVSETLPGLLPPGVVYVGSHPMAGSHRRGMAHAQADLFEGAACVVTPLPDSDPAAVERVTHFWRALGARVVIRDPEAHDVEVAWVSHLPHALAFAFARALAAAPEQAGEVVGAGFRDFTRIAHSDPELWGEILVSNRKAIGGPLQEVANRLAELARALDAGDGEAVERFVTSARAALAALGASGERERSDA